MRRSYVSVYIFVAATLVGAMGATLLCAFLIRDEAVVPKDAVGALVVLSLFLVLGELQPLRWLRLQEGGELTPSFAFALAIVALPAPLVAVCVHGAACVLADIITQKKSLRTLFNVAQTCLSLTMGILVLAAFGEVDTLASMQTLPVKWLVASLLCGATVLVVNAALTCTVLALHEGTSVLAMLRRGTFVNIVSDGILVALAPVFVIVTQRALFLLFLIVGIAAVVHFNTKRVLAAEHDARHDPLTELWNRRAFTERTEAELTSRSKDARAALLLVDLNGFKEINDRLGHTVGDLVLVETAARLKSLQLSTFVARLGGDEFAIFVAREMTRAQLTDAARSVQGTLSRPVDVHDSPVLVTASVGVAVWPDHGIDLAALVESADLAMYAAKRRGDGVGFRSETASVAGTGRITLLTELRQAVSNEEFVLAYQPIVNARNRTVAALEALIRWDHPRLGRISPAEFMPLAEQTELMPAMTEQVLNMALNDLARWRCRFPDVHVAVNASAKNLHDLTFPKTLSDALRRHNVDPKLLELEITENTVVAHPERADAVLDAIREIGVRLSIDDFGTGYSSLVRLRTLPVSTVKIDRSFVQNLGHPQDDAIVRSTIDLARSLGLVTVAEGVETDAAYQMLQRWGCELLQGFLIAAPMPIEAALAWMSSRSAAPDAPRRSVVPAEAVLA